MKIQKKILIIILSLLIVVSIASILISRNIATNIIKEQITNNLINTTQSRTKHIETLLGEYEELTKMTATEVGFRDALNENIAQAQRIDFITRRIKTIIETHGEISRIRVLDKEGIIIASSHEDTGIDKSTHEIFLKGKEGVFIGDLHLSSFTHKYVLSVAAPILLNNQFAGVLVINFEADKELFKITTGRTGLGQTGEVYLVNKDGYMISPSRFIDDVILKQKIDLKPIHTEEVISAEPPDTLPEEGVDIVRDYRGIEVLSVHAHLPEMNWSIVAQIDTQEAFAPVTQLTNTLILVFVIILFIAIFISSFVTKTITKPLRKLHQGTEEITKGNLDYKVGTPSPDEVGQLSRAFDEMTTNLKKSREELEDYSRNLEEKVEARTRELSDINQGLEKEIIIRKKAEEELKESEGKLSNIFENSTNLFYSHSPEHVLTYLSPQVEDILGYTQEEAMIRWTKLTSDNPVNEIGFKYTVKAIETGKRQPPYELELVKKNGEKIWVEVREFPEIKDGQTIAIIGSLTDITERKQAEERIKHLNLVLHAIRSVNQLIVKEKNRERLLKGACNNLIKTRGYYNAWIALLDKKGKLETYAEAGIGKAILPMVEILKKGELAVCGQKALKQQEVVTIKDPASTCPDCPLVKQYSGQSAMTIRLEYSGKVYGFMSISIPAHLADDQEEQSLFAEVAGDIALGLSNIEMGKKLDKQTHDLQQSYQRTKRAMDATVETMSKIVEVKDPYTAGHQQRVSQLTTAIAKELNLSPDKIEGVRVASLIHDIGKISVPTEILSKSITLSDIELSLIKEHSQIGYDILKAIDFSYPVADIVLQHHEKINGSGYPGGLKGDEILLEAKIICVADVVEAMSSHRPYRPALGIDAALEEISQNKAILYDPEVVDICLKLFKEKEFKFES